MAFSKIFNFLRQRFLVAEREVQVVVFGGLRSRDAGEERTWMYLQRAEEGNNL